jgi:hypothetical protein
VGGGADGVEEGGGTEIGWMKGRSRQTEKDEIYAYMISNLNLGVDSRIKHSVGLGPHLRFLR